MKKNFKILKDWLEDRKFEREICGDNQILYAILDWAVPALVAAIISFIITCLLNNKQL